MFVRHSLGMRTSMFSIVRRVERRRSRRQKLSVSRSRAKRRSVFLLVPLTSGSMCWWLGLRRVEMARAIEKGVTVLVWDRHWTVLSREPDGNHVMIYPKGGSNEIRKRVKIEQVRYVPYG